MNALASVGQLYTFILLILLFLGSGFAVWSFVNFVIERSIAKSNAKPKDKHTEPVKADNAKNIIGGFIMNSNNGWLKLAVFSFVGILTSIVILGLVSTSSSQGMNTNGQGMNMTSQTTSTHQQHQQQGSQGNMNGIMTPDNLMMQQQLNQMQLQLNQMQQQMGTMKGNMSGNMSGNMQMQGNMSNPQSGSMGGMGMMSGMGGMGGMSNMNNMPQNGGSMSGGGMGMM